MAELLLKPKEFQEQIDNFKSGADTVKVLKCSPDAPKAVLASIDRYSECIALFNEALAQFAQLMALDLETMKQIKAKWMNADSEIATKTFAEVLFGGDNNG